MLLPPSDKLLVAAKGVTKKALPQKYVRNKIMVAPQMSIQRKSADFVLNATSSREEQ